MKKVVIIGAGVSGLSTGIFLQKKHTAHERILRKTNCLKKIDKNSKKVKNAIDQTISMMYIFFIN